MQGIATIFKFDTFVLEINCNNKIFYENNSDGLLPTQYLPFHEEFNIECDEGPLKVQLNHMSDHNSDLYLKKTHTNREP